MADFTHIASGGIRFTGSASITAKVSIVYRFPTGTPAYTVHNAKKGKFDKIYIKKVKTVYPGTYLYHDTFNSLHNEYDLCSFDEAKELAIAYYERLIANTQALIDASRC